MKITNSKAVLTRPLGINIKGDCKPIRDGIAKARKIIKRMEREYLEQRAMQAAFARP